jgi:hypothetical protein
MKRAVATDLTLVTQLFLAWYSGLDMFSRGPAQATVLGFALFFTACVYTFPGWTE